METESPRIKTGICGELTLSHASCTKVVHSHLRLDLEQNMYNIERYILYIFAIIVPEYTAERH